MTGPQSRSPRPASVAVPTVSPRARVISARAARYLPSTICPSEMGIVTSSSMLPVRFSSAKSRMVTAGISSR